MKDKARRFVGNVLVCGVFAALGYVKCLGDVTNKYADEMPDKTIKVSPTKRWEISMRKKSKKEDS